MSFNAYPELKAASADFRFAPPDDLLAGRTILITGAGDGIGNALAKTSALLGANVALLGRTRSKLEATFDWIEAHTDTEPVIVPVDLAQLTEESVDTLAGLIGETYGRLDGLVHNASILGARTPIPHYPVEQWHQVMQVNVNAPFILTRGLFDLLDGGDDTSVIFVSSSVGRQARAYWGAYAVSKFALEGLSQTFADEIESAGRIRVYSVNPGATRTTMRSTAYPMEDPAGVTPAEAHMDLFSYLLGGKRHGKPLPPTGAQLDARTWKL